MATIEFLAVGQMDRFAKNIRNNLAQVRRRKLMAEQAGAQPKRDPSLDLLLAELHRLRLRLDFYMGQIAAAAQQEPVESQTLARAGDILTDAGEMIELLIWLGARSPEDAAALGEHPAASTG